MPDEPPEPTLTESGSALSAPAAAAGPTPSEDISAEGFHAADLPIVSDERYEIERELARGGMGRVLVARDRRLGRPVALKELLDPKARGAARFVREALITARLQHPAIVPVYDAGRRPDGAPFYAMRAVAGRALGELIQERRSLDERLALLPNLSACVDAIAYAHARGVVHRDLKPSNIMVGDFGETVVIDWGLARQTAPDALPDAPDSDPDSDAGAPEGAPATTAVGAVLGTPAYMPPEQARGEVVDARADVYALGAILYHLLVGSAPYAGRGSNVIDAVRGGPPDPVTRQPGVPRELVTIVERAMAREPRKRYPSAAELSADLRRFQTGQLVAAHRYSRGALLVRWLRRHRAAVGVGVAALALLVTLGTVALLRVLRERDRADRGRRDAVLARRDAVVAADEAVARADALTLVQAQAALERDPTEALAWLKTLSPGFARWPAARVIAADAESRGVAAHVLTGHQDWLGALAFSPDGRRLASADNRGGVLLWDLTSNQQRRLDGHKGGRLCLAFSRDGSKLASGGADRRLMVWDVATGVGTRLTTGPELGAIERLAFRGDDLISISTDLTIRVWPAAGGEPRVITLPDISTERQTGRFAVLSGDLLRAATTASGGVLHVWDLVTGAGRALGAGADLAAIALSHDGSRAVTADQAGKLHIWEVATGTQRELDDGRTPHFIALSPDGDLLATAGEDVIHVFDLERGRHRDLTGHTGLVWRLAFLPGGKLVSLGADQTLRVWRPETGDVRIHRGHTAWLEALAVSSDGHWLASGGGDRSVRVWSVGAGAPRDELAPTSVDATGPASAAAISADGRTTALAYPAQVALWRAGQAQLELLPVEAAQSLGLSGDGDRVAWLRRDATLELADLRTGERRPLLEDLLARGLCLSHDGNLVAGPDTMLGVVGFRLAPPGRLELPASGPLLAGFACSPDGARVAASAGGEVLLWDVATATRQAIPLGGPEAAAVAFSRDGTRLAAGDAQGGLHVFELGGTRLATLTGTASPIEQLVFPDADTLVSRNADGEAWMWELPANLGRRLPWTLHGRSALAIASDGTIIAASTAPIPHRLLWRDDLPRGPALRTWLDLATNLWR